MQIDFWLDSRLPGQFADIMVAPRAQPYFIDFLVKHDLQYKITIDDVERMIYENEHININKKEPDAFVNKNDSQISWDNFFKFRTRLKDEPIKFGDF